LTRISHRKENTTKASGIFRKWSLACGRMEEEDPTYIESLGNIHVWLRSFDSTFGTPLWVFRHGMVWLFLHSRNNLEFVKRGSKIRRYPIRYHWNVHSMKVELEMKDRFKDLWDLLFDMGWHRGKGELWKKRTFLESSV
jgi:hypothetical protein